MTAELLQRLVDFNIRLAFKSSFNPSELKELYSLYNDVTGENRKITTCSSCLASVISKLKKTCRANQIR